MAERRKPDLHYWAFISYSQMDRKWSDWLHKALENYRIPNQLVGRKTRDGLVPRRIFPVFRDRDELPTCPDLDARIRIALEQSRYLIVICSPFAASSRWVQEEIRVFKRHNVEDRVLCLIVDGEPNTTYSSEKTPDSCFPSSLLYRFNAEGEFSEQSAEPLAADVREGRDSKRDAKLKIVAGLLGVGLDELKQRDVQRRFRVRLAGAAIACIVLGGAAGILKHYEGRSHADRERVSATIDTLLIHSEATGRRFVMEVLETTVYQAMMKGEDVSKAHENAWQSVRGTLRTISENHPDLSLSDEERVPLSKSEAAAKPDLKAWMARAERWHSSHPPRFEFDPASLGGEKRAKIRVGAEAWDMLSDDEAYVVSITAASMLASNQTADATQKTWLLLAYLIAHDITGEIVLERLFASNSTPHVVKTLDSLDSPLLKLFVAHRLVGHVQLFKFGNG